MDCIIDTSGEPLDEIIENKGWMAFWRSTGGGGTSTRMPSGRADCDGELDAGWLCRPDVQDNRLARPGPPNMPSPVKWGEEKAYVFVRNGAVWTQQQKLTASDG